MAHNELETLDRLIVRNHAAWEQSHVIRKRLWKLRDAADEHQRPVIQGIIDLLDQEIDRLTAESVNLSTAWSLEYDCTVGHVRKGVLAVVK